MIIVSKRGQECHSKKLLVPNELPDKKASTVCCLSYGLSWNKTRLVAKGLSCVLQAIGLYQDGKALIIIFSNAYEQYWQKEADYKNRVAKK